jgi:hypothetical protein
MIRCNNNFIFDVVNENDEYILRITHESQKSKELLISENHWLDFLRKNDVLVSQPIESEYGNMIETVQHKKQTYYSLLYKKVLGKSFKSNEISAELLTKWGALLGELHNKSRGYFAHGHKHRSEEWHYDFLNPEVYLPAEKVNLIDKIVLNRKKISEITKSDSNYNIIHYDINPSNFVEADGQLSLFDFDDCHMDFYLADISSSLFYLLDIPNIFYTRNYSISRKELLRMISNYFIVSYKTNNPDCMNDYTLMNLFLQRRAINLFVNFYRSHDIEQLNTAHPYVLAAFEDAIANEVQIIPDSILSEWN